MIRLAAVAGALVLALTLPSCTQPTRAVYLHHVNQLHTPDLLVSHSAQAKAQAWAEHLAGGAPYTHSVLTEGMGHTRWEALGEIVGRGLEPGVTVETMIDDWLASPRHAAVLTDPQYTHVGIGVAWDAGNHIYVVAVFVRFA